MELSTFFIKALILLLAIAVPCGCSSLGSNNAEILPVNRQVQSITWFFCGCDECTHWLKTIPTHSLDRSLVLFAGSEGDASEFRRKFAIAGQVESDGSGAKARSLGITECPAVVISGRGAKRVIGNGQTPTQDDWRVMKSLGDVQ